MDGYLKCHPFLAEKEPALDERVVKGIPLLSNLTAWFKLSGSDIVDVWGSDIRFQNQGNWARNSPSEAEQKNSRMLT
ncbi:hypothetical protein CEXT_285681 [Caerostris extrusa]|uniref:Uncharacterized protein n=1 Tax=Caerostris extrusa TaxID=172846 RepID=A0AAV4XFD1_CAEEX|nr:hypothetical protein CEXT_285681 [Caerostris extrusa]